MSIKPRGTLSPQSVRIDAPAGMIFRRLVRHFLARLLRSGSPEAEFEMGAGVLLGLLAAPGAFQSFLLLDKYSTLFAWLRGQPHTDFYRASTPDKYLFLALAMGITGIVTVLKWDRILPDAQDYLNFAPLPIRPRSILLANAAAIALAVLVLAVDVNAASSILFPLFVIGAAEAGPAAFAGFVAVHAASLVLASVFTFCAVFALLGTLAALLPRQTFQTCSSWLRGAILVAFVMLLLSGFASSAVLRQMGSLEWLPSLWFLGLYQTLQNRPTPEMARLAHHAIAGLAGAGFLVAASYAASYGKQFSAVLEGARQPSEQRVLAAALFVLDRLSFRSRGLSKAGYRFVTRALLRNEGHRLCLAVSLGLGWLLAVQSQSLEEGSLMSAYLLVAGLRLAFELPASVSANWIFRTLVSTQEAAALPVARQVMLNFLALGVLLPAFAWAWSVRGLGSAAIHTAYVLALTVCVMEILLWGYRKLPLTSPIPGFRDHLPLSCLSLFLGFEAFSHLGAAMERWMFLEPVRFLLVPATMIAAWYGNQKRLKDALEAGELQLGIRFDSAPEPVMERLNLSDGD